MLLKASSAISLSSASSEVGGSIGARGTSSLSSVLRLSRRRPKNGLSLVAMASGEAGGQALTGVVFEPFEEVKKELSLVPSVPHQSLARQKYVDECEAAINEQIK